MGDISLLPFKIARERFMGIWNKTTKLKKNKKQGDLF